MPPEEKGKESALRRCGKAGFRFAKRLAEKITFYWPPEQNKSLVTG